jgi:hypothetical protein
MSRLKEIQINPFQLKRLLNKEQWKDYNYLLEQGVFCSTCGGRAIKGIKVAEIYLTNLNDILVRGTCKVCGGKVARIMEFGEDKVFFEMANAFRASLED